MLLLPDQFVPGFHCPDPPGDDPYWFIFAEQKLLIIETGSTAAVPTGKPWPLPSVDPKRRLFMGHWANNPCLAAEVDQDCQIPAHARWIGLREAWTTLESPLVGLAGQGLQLIDWDRSHQFCSRCGQLTVRRETERARHCQACGMNQYPRVAPAVMMRITRGRQILLARSPRFVAGMYSVLAGFVDPGETLEQAVHREVYEEVRLRVTNLRYITSQPWPFPHSLMIGFSAEYLSGEIVPAEDEIEDAQWFDPDALPKIPATISIARFLIDQYLIEA